MNPKERFIAACLRQEVDRPPVWMMRQAGRYLPQYMAVKAKHPTKEMMQTPEIACEITLQPVDLVGVDAAILYSDILMIPDALDMGLNFVPGDGPKFAFKANSEENIAKLNTKDLQSRLSYVFEAARLCVQKLPDDYPLLGFAGAPFTVACYMIAGGSEKGFPSVLSFAEESPELFHQVMGILADATVDYLIEQANAGAVALQLFDTWAGLLNEEKYKELCYPYTQKILTALADQGLNTIHFIKGGSHLFPTMQTLPSKVLGVDWTMNLADAFAQAGNNFALQGNFDPTWLLEDTSVIEQKLKDMVAQVPNVKQGYILNLGHGIGKETPVEHAKFFVEKAKELTS